MKKCLDFISLTYTSDFDKFSMDFQNFLEGNTEELDEETLLEFETNKEKYKTLLNNYSSGIKMELFSKLRSDLYNAPPEIKSSFNSLINYFSSLEDNKDK